MNKILRITAMSAALLFIGGQQADAASWRINSDATKKAHFLDINAAMASSEVMAGDTLYLDPGCNLTATQNVTKQVTIVGCGYFLGDSPHTTATIKGTLNLKKERIKVEGAELLGTTYISSSNVTIERCKTYDIMPSGTAYYATIRQCYVNNAHVGPKNNKDSKWNYWTIENCIIIHDASYGCISDLSFATIRNNYIKEGYSSTNSLNRCDNCTIINNIISNTGNYNYNYYLPDYSTIQSNVLSRQTDESFPNNIFLNKQNIETEVFALEGNYDQRYRLKEDSPAKGAATDGGDCGPFGGLYPYVPSGYPLGMPHFISSVVSPRPQNGQVSINQQVTVQKR